MADLLIKNMGYPQSCGVCSLKYNEYLKMMDEDKYGTKIRSVSKVYHVCRLVGRDVTEFADSGKRCPDCPLVEVEPLVEKYRLYNHLENKYCEGCAKDCDGSCTVEKMLDDIDDFPTVAEAGEYECPHYQGVCGLDESIICFSKSNRNCDIKLEASE